MNLPNNSYQSSSVTGSGSLNPIGALHSIHIDFHHPPSVRAWVVCPPAYMPTRSAFTMITPSRPCRANPSNHAPHGGATWPNRSVMFSRRTCVLWVFVCVCFFYDALGTNPRIAVVLHKKRGSILCCEHTFFFAHKLLELRTICWA